MCSSDLRTLSLCSTAILGTIVFLAAVRPPSLIVWLNIFAFGGMEAAFLWPLVLGLYWKRANAAGALCSSVCGTACYFIMGVTIKNFYGMNVIIPSLVLGLLVFIAVSLFTPRPGDDVIETFWGE